MMESSIGADAGNEQMNDSWVEYGAAGANSAASLAANDQDTRQASPSNGLSLANSSVERLLLEAQKESSCASSYINSRESSQESPKSLHSPSSELLINTGAVDAISQVSSEMDPSNWVLNWSSRPEIIPPSDMSAIPDNNHVAPKRHRLSIRNTRLMRGILFVVEHFPVLLVSHACSFLLGAVTVVVYLKKYRRFSPTVPLLPADG